MDPWRPAPVLHAEGLVARRFVGDEVDELTDAVVASEAELGAFMPWALGYDQDVAHTFLTSARTWWESGQEFNYAVRSAADGRLCGAVGVMTRRGPGLLELGYWTRTDLAGRGIATRACGRVAAEVARAPGIRALQIHHDVRNLASGAVGRRLGFRPAGQYDQPAEDGTGPPARFVVLERPAAEHPHPAATLDPA